MVGLHYVFCLLLAARSIKRNWIEESRLDLFLYMSGITGIVASFNYLGLDKDLGATLQSLGSYMR